LRWRSAAFHSAGVICRSFHPAIPGADTHSEAIPSPWPQRGSPHGPMIGVPAFPICGSCQGQYSGYAPTVKQTGRVGDGLP
jgi:hypothetical protein